jgi:hypothetical protein
MIIFSAICSTHNKDRNEDLRFFLNSKNLKDTGVKRSEHIDNIILKKVEDIVEEMISTFLLMKNSMQD